MRLFFIYIAALFPLIGKNKEVYETPLKAVKATRASKSTQRKTDRGRVRGLTSFAELFKFVF